MEIYYPNPVAVQLPHAQFSFLSSARCLLGLDGCPLLADQGTSCTSRPVDGFQGFLVHCWVAWWWSRCERTSEELRPFWLARLNGTVACAVYSKSKMHSPFALCAHLSGRWRTMSGFTASFTHSTVEFEPLQWTLGILLIPWALLVLFLLELLGSGACCC